jgi:hypothetical protein
MHLEVLVEDQSGRELVEWVMRKLLGTNGQPHSWRTHAYRGVGVLPPGLRQTTDPAKRVLLDQLPRLLKGYGKSLQGQDAAVIIVVDVDRRPCVDFKRELNEVLDRCSPKPRVLFRLAIEETEAWLLGDRQAILAAFPLANVSILNSYIQDSICGTWEVLADALYPGGARRLKSQGYPVAGAEKMMWARRIGEHLNVEHNGSPSFRTFVNGIAALISSEKQNARPNS